VSWRCSVALFLAGFSVLFGLYVTQPILPDLAAGLKVPVAAAAWTITASALGVAIAAPVAGAVSDRFGRRLLAGPAIVGMAVPGAAGALAGTLPALLWTRFAQGLLVAMVFTAAVAYTEEEAPPGHAAQLNATYVSGSVLGGFSGRFLTGLVTAHQGWRGAFWWLAALSVAVGLGVLVLLPPERRFVPVASLGTSLRNLARQVRNRRLLGTCALGATLLFGQVAVFTYCGLRLSQPPFRFGPGALGAVFAVFLLGVVVTPLAGRWIVRAGHRRVLTAAVLLSFGGLAITQLPIAAAVIAGLACCSTGTFVGQACATNAAARLAPGMASSGVGLYVTSYYLGGSIGAVAPEPAWSVAGWPGCSAMIGAVLAAGLAAALVAWRPVGGDDARCRHLPQAASTRRR
jgi:MFS transporter, YNFM family, putative membrane transport protein